MRLIRSNACRPTVSRRSAGFTVIEMTISLLVMVVVLLGMLSLFDFTNRLSNVQTNVADMQQALRIAQQDVVRTVRMAGRGPIPLGQPPAGISVAVWNSVPAGTLIGGGGTPPVVPASDILAVRGVFSTPIYQVNSSLPSSFTISQSGGVYTGKVVIGKQTPTSIPQDLTPLRDALLSAQESASKPRERLLLISARNPAIWGVVEIDPTNSTVDPANEASLRFKSVPADDPVYFDMPVGTLGDITSVAFVGLLEEHRFYVRELFETAANGTQDLASRFSRARVFPGTDRPWQGRGDTATPDGNHPSWSQDVSDNIVDLQVALAFDSPQGGGRMIDDENNTGNDDRIFEAADGLNDDWLFNDNQAVNPVQWANQQLYFIRLTTLARTDRRDPNYQAPQLVRLEDHDLTTSRFNNRTDRMFRYRPLQTLIDMRNM